MFVLVIESVHDIASSQESLYLEPMQPKHMCRLSYIYAVRLRKNFRGPHFWLSEVNICPETGYVRACSELLSLNYRKTNKQHKVRNVWMSNLFIFINYLFV